MLGLLFWPAASFAEPKIPALTGRVVDNASILNSDARQLLENDLAAYEDKTSTQIVVVTLPDLQGYDIEDWGIALLRGWGIGQKSKNNGVVLVVAPNERKVRIETGYGVEGALPDATASAIIRSEIVPHFRNQDYAGGISSGVQAIEQALAGEFKADTPTGPQVVSLSGIHIAGQVVPWMTLFFVAMWILIAVISLSQRRRRGYRYYNSNSGNGWTNNSGGFGGGFGGGGFGGGGGSGGGGGASGGW